MSWFHIAHGAWWVRLKVAAGDHLQQQQFHAEAGSVALLGVAPAPTDPADPGVAQLWPGGGCRPAGGGVGHWPLPEEYW